MGSYRDWHAVQHELEEAGDADFCRALADDLWALLPDLDPRLGEERGRFWNNLGAFFGTPGPAASLDRAESCFARALDAWRGDADRRARALHNRGSARTGVGASAEDLGRAAADLEEALVYRNGEREIARAVTLHHLGIARRKLAELAPEGAAEELERSAGALSEALEIRARLGLTGGTASSRFQLGITLAGLRRFSEARRALETAAGELDAAGSPEQAGIAREAAARLPPGKS
ncbi:MAG TPA: hypothetical protein VFS34_09375 [Thermoanaerobaculia bacterium]|nr:hypothetical protein [Thermoanaerobaculia bacterium]